MTNPVTLVFTPDQVQNLIAWQSAGAVHPFTCGHCEDGAPLTPTVRGWICQLCDYRQDWAHDFMLDGSALAAMKGVVEELKSGAADFGGHVDFLDHLRAVNADRWAAWAGSSEVDTLYASNEFGGEAGEVQNVVKKLVREARGWRGSRSTPQALADEIADCIICLDSIARGYGIDMIAAVVNKFNATSIANDFPHRIGDTRTGEREAA